MRRLALIFLVLVAVGATVAAFGLYLGRGRGVASPLGGKRVLTLTLSEPVEEHRAEVDLPFLERVEPVDVETVWRALAVARRDDSVLALALRIDDADFGLAKAQELRRQLADFAAAGKRVACYFETAGEGTNGTLDYYLATACPEISLSPAGELNLLGLFVDPLFFRGALDKLKIEPSFLAAGRYKSAAESFTEHAHSPAAREALGALLDSFFAQIVGEIAGARSLDPAGVRALVDQAPLSAQAALRAKLVDKVEYPDEFRARLDAELGGSPDWEDLAGYAARLTAPAGGGEQVALVFASGTIVRGGGGTDSWSGERYLGSDELGSILARLTDDDDTKAVVLRVDSPGGSAVASDLLLRKVELLARAKPVVVSMSDLAASGGYYIASRASRIVAEPGTLTGSIGVVMGKLATAGLEQEHLGVTRDPLARGAHAGIYSSARPFDDAERALLERRMSETYARFLDHVAEGRSLPLPTVESVAQGRVWSGADALEHGLVDELGGIDAALAAARRLAGLEADAGVVRTYPKSDSLWEWLAGARPAPFASDLLASDLRALARLAGLVGGARAPEALELPRELRALARPF
jgi:protease-4